MKKIISLMIFCIFLGVLYGFTSPSYYRKNVNNDNWLKPQYIVSATYSNIEKNDISNKILWLMNNNQANYAMYLSTLLTNENYINGCYKDYVMDDNGVDIGLALAELYDIREQGILEVIIDDFDNDRINELCIMRLERSEDEDYNDIKYSISLQIVDEDNEGKLNLSKKEIIPIYELFEYPVFEIYLGLRKKDDKCIIYCNGYGYWNFHVDGISAKIYTMFYDGINLIHDRCVSYELSGDGGINEEETKIAEKFVMSENIVDINNAEELFIKMCGDIITENNGFSNIYYLRRTPNGKKFIMSDELGYYNEGNANLYDIYYNNGSEYILTFSNQ